MKDTVIEPVEETAGAPAPTLPAMKRAFGRSFADFRDQPTETGLLPAEDKLIAAAARGDVCELTGIQDLANARALFRSADADAAVFALAVDAVRDRHSQSKEIRKRIAENIDRLQRPSAQLTDLSTAPDELSPPNPEEEDGALLAILTELEKFRPAYPEDLAKRIAEQPRALQPLFDDVRRFLPRLAEERDALVAKLSTEPEALRPAYMASLDLFKRETWRLLDPADKSLHVRAGVIRFLLLGGDDVAPVHEKGIFLNGAVVTGLLDCDGARLIRPAVFANCVFEGRIILRDAQARSLIFHTCLVRGFRADRAAIDGGIFIRQNCRVEGEVRAAGATINGNLECTDSTFLGATRSALFVAGATCRGSMLLNGIRAEGCVFLSGTEISGNLNCRDGLFLGRGGASFVANGIDVTGDASLSGKFRAEGSVVLNGGKIRGVLNCSGGKFLSPSSTALNADRIVVDGSVRLSDDFRAEGEVRFLNAKIGSSTN